MVEQAFAQPACFMSEVLAMPGPSKTLPVHPVIPPIPDYLIYDEIKQRRERAGERVDRLDLPLYRPERPAPPRERRDEPPKQERGVMIINMGDLFDDEAEPGDGDD